MCGIGGMVNVSYNERIANRLLDTMLHRGPDGSGVFLTNECCLVHTRLAIIDPEGGHQPMTMTMGCKQYCIVYNGELYNTNEIRNELELLGHTFKSRSDTEVLLCAYIQWQDDVVLHLNGIFSFAIWDCFQKKLFLARDRIGVKPLFYKEHDGGLIFASEIKTILAYPTVKAELDTVGAAEIILLGPGRTPGSGVLKSIFELEPGCCGYFDNGKLRWHRYWKLTDKEHTDSFEETAEKVRYLVTDAICRQMVSDVPLGTFLSGGLDSSLITSVCSQEKRHSEDKLRTFSVDYKNNDKYFTPGKFQPNSDNHYINIVQDHLGTEHYWTILTPENLINALQDATIARDLPGMADVDFSLLAFCKEIRQHVKVALSGECADEIFGGYPWFTDPDVRALDGFPWAQNTKQRLSYLNLEMSEKIDGINFIRDRYNQTILDCDILPDRSSDERRMKEMINLNHRWFMQTLLDRKDRMSMFSGLEVRVPFCDHRLVEYMYSVPWKFKYYKKREKGLLRYAMREYLPLEVLNRKKSPYPKTFDPQYMQIVSSMLREVIENCNSPILQIVRKEALADLLNAEYEWPWYGQLMKVPQTIAFMLQINFWLDYYNVSLV